MSESPSQVFVVIPSYNEGAVLPGTVAPLVEAGYSVVVVDDGSSDDTWDQLARLPVHAVRHPINLGQGAALQTGMTYAVRAGARYVVHFDADGQHDAGDIERLLEPLRRGEAEIVLGSRFLRADDAAAVPRLKRFLLRAGIRVNWILTGLLLSDAHNGFRALTRHAAQTIQLESNRFEHATELLSQIREKKLRYVEVPTRIEYTEYSKAKGQSMWNSVNIVIDFVVGRWFR